MKSLATANDRMGIGGLVDFREGIEQTPSVTRLEGLVTGLPPLLEHIRHLTWSDGGAIHGPDDDIMSHGIPYLAFLISFDPLIEASEPISQLPHSPRR